MLYLITFQNLQELKMRMVHHIHISASTNSSTDNENNNTLSLR